MTPVSPLATATPVDPALRKAAQGFEAVMLRQVFAAMRKASLGGGLFDSGATQNFREMADARTADTMAGIGAFGIAALIEKQLTAQKEPTP